MGLSEHMLGCISSLLKGDYAEARKSAFQCLDEDTTAKNRYAIEDIRKRYNEPVQRSVSLPLELMGLLVVDDLCGYRPQRYCLFPKEKALLEEIRASETKREVLQVAQIPYTNSTLLYGKPGTGKTAFAKYVAKELGLPFAYLNFSTAVNSLLGQTSKNIKAVFDYCKNQDICLMLDELDCIGIARGNDSGAGGEMARTTISLMQCLDEFASAPGKKVLLAATNRMDRLDEALIRRFQRSMEFLPLQSKGEVDAFVSTYVGDVKGLLSLTDKKEKEILDAVLGKTKNVISKSDLEKILISAIIKAA